ncbi:MAG: hypothetical protein CMJ21_04160 [Phycisphaerae bacterium]|nr:hypothetical protein [Phycisphaerae bacterium]
MAHFSSKEYHVALPQNLRIGEILVEQGVLSQTQVGAILEQQKETGIPFGVLAERLFGVTVDSIEEAWIEQYARLTGQIDLSQEPIDSEALRVINRRQAWQFEILPLRFEPGGELLMAATRTRLARAVTFVANRIQPIVYIRLAESEQLREFLREHYPMPEVTQELLDRAMELTRKSA